MRWAGAAVLAAHEAAWDARWTASDVLIEGDDESQRAVRFAVYHLTSTANPEDDRVSIGAGALTGDAYLGHVFWDTEIYLLPFYTAVWPEAARALLMYRYHTLPGARAKAAHFGFKGALYAWESQTPAWRQRPERVLVVPDGTVVEILTGQMGAGAEFPSATKPRCAHGGCARRGRCDAVVAARLGDAEMALRYLRETAATDLDLDPNSAGGVRIAGLGALWQVVMLGFAGLDLRGDTLGIDPRLPPRMARPLVPRVLERPVRSDPHCWQDLASNAAAGRADGHADRRCHAGN